ncbi:hypothetical protein Bbelb_111310 [Branchiostoma belcheri]|nr:hypothetical protein Bbelb_111310 [Branchiostoma belcheri]
MTQAPCVALTCFVRCPYSNCTWYSPRTDALRLPTFLHVDSTQKHVRRVVTEALGTSLGVMDVRQFVDVGLTNHVVVRGLLLQSGHTYYASVRATDHVGPQTTATSAGLTIDTTPPSVTNTRIDVGGRYLMSTDVVSVNWDGLFFDLESDKFFIVV